MDLRLKDKVSLVAGSSKGLGKAVAEGLAAEGSHIMLCARTEEKLKIVASELAKAYGVTVLYYKADLSNTMQVKELLEYTKKKYGKVDILVNNAGGPPTGTFLDFDEDRWIEAFRLNFLSLVTLTRGVIPKMMEQRWGRIINLTSVAVKQPIDGLILSNGIRAGIIGLSKTLATELAPYNITVNNICPGYTKTERVQDLSRELAKKEGVEQKLIFSRWEEKIPMGRLADPNEIADLAVFLASERASYITGTTIQVDGGYYRGLL